MYYILVKILFIEHTYIYRCGKSKTVQRKPQTSKSGNTTNNRNRISLQHKLDFIKQARFPVQLYGGVGRGSWKLPNRLFSLRTFTLSMNPNLFHKKNAVHKLVHTILVIIRIR